MCLSKQVSSEICHKWQVVYMCELCFLFVTAGIAPHCLDPGTVRSVTVEKFGGDNWEESMQAHKSIRNMSVATVDIQQNKNE